MSNVPNKATNHHLGGKLIIMSIINTLPDKSKSYIPDKQYLAHQLPINHIMDALKQLAKTMRVR